MITAITLLVVAAFLVWLFVAFRKVVEHFETNFETAVEQALELVNAAADIEEWETEF